VRGAVHHWQQAMLLAVLAHSRSPSQLVMATDSFGRTALHIASKAGNSLAVDALYHLRVVMITIRTAVD
jgi:ankyrin repeat protein